MIIDVVLFVVGLAIIVNTLLSAIRTVVIPHGKSVRLTVDRSTSRSTVA